MEIPRSSKLIFALVLTACHIFGGVTSRDITGYIDPNCLGPVSGHSSLCLEPGVLLKKDTPVKILDVRTLGTDRNPIKVCVVEDPFKPEEILNIPCNAIRR